jgi:carboxylesterase
MFPMGEYLAQQGYTVMGVRLAGHATRPLDIRRSSWVDWLASMEDGFHLLQGVTRNIFVMGLSMGGIMALIAAARYPIQGAVAMSTPDNLPQDWRLRFLRPLSLLMPEISKGPPDWHNPQNQKDHLAYPNWPTAKLIDLGEIIQVMRSGLSTVKIPVLLMQSRQDTTISPASMQNIFDSLPGPQKEMLWVENSGHVITREPCREQVFAAAAGFVRRIEQNL